MGVIPLEKDYCCCPVFKQRFLSSWAKKVLKAFSVSSSAPSDVMR